MLHPVRHCQIITTGVVSQRAGWAWRLATYCVPLKQTVVCLAGVGRRRPRWTLHSALLLRLTADAIYLLTTWFPATRRASLQSLTWLVLAVGTHHQTAIPEQPGGGASEGKLDKLASRRTPRSPALKKPMPVPETPLPRLFSNTLARPRRRGLSLG